MLPHTFDFKSLSGRGSQLILISIGAETEQCRDIANAIEGVVRGHQNQPDVRPDGRWGGAVRAHVTRGGFNMKRLSVTAYGHSTPYGHHRATIGRASIQTTAASNMLVKASYLKLIH